MEISTVFINDYVIFQIFRNLSIYSFHNFSMVNKYLSKYFCNNTLWKMQLQALLGEEQFKGILCMIDPNNFKSTYIKCKYIMKIISFKNENGVVPRTILDIFKADEISIYNSRGLFPIEICCLNHITKLFIFCQLVSVPKELNAMENLKVLMLNTNKINSIEKGTINKLSNLEYFDLEGNGIVEFPPDICDLPNLKELHLQRNQISSIPREIVKLKSIEKVFLFTNKIKHIPPEFGNLYNLKILTLDSNQIQYLPSGIGNLYNLEILILSNNLLVSLPPNIGNLSKLTVLTLSHNKLLHLPSALKHLNNLKQLCLSNNALKTIPHEICKLSNLKYLNLVNNKLTSLPFDMQCMTNLQKLHLDYNPIQYYPNLKSCTITTHNTNIPNPDHSLSINKYEMLHIWL